MLSKETLKLACDLMINLAENEKKVEINRQVLGENLDFDAYQVFAYLDPESKNYINEINIINFLQKRNGIPCSIDEIQYLIFLYDENCDGKLSYTEFLNFVLSDNNYALRKDTRERVGTCYGKSILPFNVEYSLVKLFQRELDLIRTTWTIIAELKTRDDFNIHDLFHYIKGYGIITSESMKLFLQSNFVEFNEEDIRCIIKRLDLNKDSKVNFCEFHAFFCFPNLKCTCCSYCDCNSKNSNRNNNNIYYNDNNMYISNINNQLNQAIDNSINLNNDNSNYNNNPKSKLSIRLSPQRSNKINKIHRAQSSNNIKVNSSNNSDINSEEDTALSPSLHLIPSPKRTFSPNSNLKNSNNEFNINDPIIIPKNRTMNQFYNPQTNIPKDKDKYKNFSNNSSIYLNDNFNDSDEFNKNNENIISPFDRKIKCKYCNNYPCYCNKKEFKTGENNFFNYIYKLIEIESEIEQAKIDLIMRSDFNVEDAFRIFENPENEKISFSDLEKGLKQLGIYASFKEIRLLMRRVDIKKKGYIDFSDFFDLLVPFQKKYRDNVERRIPSTFIPSYNKSEIFLLTTKIYLINLFRFIISCEDQLNIIRENTFGIKTQLERIFNKIDHTGLGYISDMELYMFLKNSGINCSELQNALAFIRFDKNRDGKIEIWEIEEELTPS